ncbi:hypothetical protein DVB87_01810, partial [Tsukamurella tyrosinosolvens]
MSTTAVGRDEPAPRGIRRRRRPVPTDGAADGRGARAAPARPCRRRSDAHAPVPLPGRADRRAARRARRHRPDRAGPRRTRGHTRRCAHVRCGDRGRRPPPAARGR